MAQRKSEDKAALARVLKLIDQLSPTDRDELYRKLDLKAFTESWI